MISTDELVLLLAGLIAFIFAVRSLARLARDRRHGQLRSVDVEGDMRTLYSARFGLSGRPDAVRTLPDGRPVPVEWKSRAVPSGGPPRSHRVQVLAYALLLEETTGRTPPYGLLRYGDGSEWEVPFDRRARAELAGLLTEVRSRYDGRATPSPARCGRCRWRTVCDARADAA